MENDKVSNDKVSIVVAIYKSEKFLDKLIHSIIEQTYQNIEVYLVDDGSPDRSGEICDKYANLDDRIHVIHKKNGGTCEARNVGIEHCSGKYLTIIDGDDWLAPDYIEYLVKLIKMPGVDMALTDSIFTTRDQVQNSEDHVKIIDPEEATVQLICKLDIGPWNKLYKLDLIRENNLSFSVPWSGEGLYFSVMAAQYSRKIAMGHKRIYNYRLNNAGSGLTHYNVTMGTNALWNIKHTGECIIHKTKRTTNAVNWHIWKNNYFLLTLIVGSKTEKDNTELMESCINYLRKNAFYVISHSEFSIKQKIGMYRIALDPMASARRAIKKKNAALKKDTME